MTNDFIISFHEHLTEWLDHQLCNQPLIWGFHNISRAVSNYLWYSNLYLRDNYIRCALQGDTDYLNRIDLRIPRPEQDIQPIIEDDLNNHPWRKILEKYNNCILIYADNPRHFHFLLRVMHYLNSQSQPVVLLTQTKRINGIQDTNIRPLSLIPVITKAVTASGFYKVSHRLTEYIHTLHCYIHWMRPRVMICCDGCQTQYQLAAIYCRDLGIPTVCVQMGWPGFIHSGFQKLPYAHFLSWGKPFSEILQAFSPQTEFHVIGRLGDVNRIGSHDAITFFMQAPIFVSSEQYFSLLIRLIRNTASRYPSKRIIVRPHPEYNYDKRISAIPEGFGNIFIDKRRSVNKTYQDTDIAVSHFSSCLVESTVFRCTPLMFNPTYGFEYPLLSSNFKACNEEEFFLKLELLLQRTNDESIEQKIRYVGNDSFTQFTNFIKSIIK